MPKPIKLSPAKSALVRRLGQQPYSAADELKGWPNVSSRVGDHLNWLVKHGYAKSTKIGWMRDAQHRFALDDKGMEAYRDQNSGAKTRTTIVAPDPDQVLSWGPALELLYHAAPRAWSPRTIEKAPSMIWGEYEDTIPLEMEPVDFIWALEGPVQAVVNFRTAAGTATFSLPLVLYGRYALEIGLPDTLEELFEALPTLPDSIYKDAARPPGLIIIAADPLAAMRARREISPELPRAIITYGCDGVFAERKQRFGVIGIDKMTSPAYPKGLVLGPGQNTAYEGKRLNVWSGSNRTSYAALTEIADCRGLRMRHLANRRGLADSQTRRIVNDLAIRRFVAKEGPFLHLASGGRIMLAEHGRSDYRSMTKLLGRTPAQPPDPREAKRLDELARLRIKIKTGHMALWSGRSMGIGDPEHPKWYPDLWLGIRAPLEPHDAQSPGRASGPEDAPWSYEPGTRARFLFLPVLFEPSATGPTTVAIALRPVREAGPQIRRSWFIMAVCGSDEGVGQFMDIGDDLNLAIVTYRRLVDPTTAFRNVLWQVSPAGTRKFARATLPKFVATMSVYPLPNWSS